MRANDVLYHGTKDENLAKAIIACGEIRPGATIQGRGHLASVARRTYLTRDLRYAAVYALGGDFVGTAMGDQHIKVRGRYGYAFTCDPAQLRDPQPDEDCIGAFIGRHTKQRWDTSAVPWRNLGLHVDIPEDDPEHVQKLVIWRKIATAMTPRQFQRSAQGLIAYQASGGKRALKALTRADKELLIKWGAHIAHLGPIKPTACWRIDRTKSAKIAKDGSNFLQIAEPVPLHG